MTFLNNKLLGDADFTRRLKSLVLPIMVQSFMLALVSATDAIMLGFVDQASLSAVSLGGQVQFILSLVVTGVTAGLGILAAQYWGKGDAVVLEKIVPIALRVNLITGVFFTAAAGLAPGLLMRVLTNDESLLGLGADYLRAVSLSYLLCAVSQIYLTVLKNTDHADLSSRISSTAVVFNILANAVLIFGLCGAPRLGVVGAAYATVLARLLELIWSAWETKKPGRVRVRWDRLLTKETDLRTDFNRYTGPVLLASLVWGVAYSLYTVYMGHLGSDAVAANSVTTIIRTLVSCGIRGLGGGTGVLMGHVLGANDLVKAKDYGGRLTRLSILTGVTTGLLLMAISPFVVRLAPLTETAAGYLQGMLLFCGVNLMFQSVNHVVLDGVFCAGGDSRFDMIGNIFAMWCFSVPVGYLAAFVFHAPVLAVYCIVNLDEIVKIPAVYLRYKKYIWLRNITREVTE